LTQMGDLRTGRPFLPLQVYIKVLYTKV